MKNLSLLTVFAALALSSASYAAEPKTVINCITSNLADAGYSYVVKKSDEGDLTLTVSTINGWGPSKIILQDADAGVERGTHKSTEVIRAGGETFKRKKVKTPIIVFGDAGGNFLVVITQTKGNNSYAKTDAKAIYGAQVIKAGTEKFPEGEEIAFTTLQCNVSTADLF